MGNSQLTVQGGHPAMTMTAPVGTIHRYADPQAGVDRRFFRELDHELSDRGFLVTSAENLITPPGSVFGVVLLYRSEEA